MSQTVPDLTSANELNSEFESENGKYRFSHVSLPTQALLNYSYIQLDPMTLTN